jgi:hypothetical protein
MNDDTKQLIKKKKNFKSGFFHKRITKGRNKRRGRPHWPRLGEDGSQ